MIRHDRSLRKAGWLATVAMVAAALFAPATASAHTPVVSLSCDRDHVPMLSINLTAYQNDNQHPNKNSVKASIDGSSVLDKTFFGQSFAKTISAGSPSVGHAAVVDVYAFDDPHGDHGWTKTFNLTVGACQTPSQSPSPTPTPTDPPTPTPTLAPTPTPTLAPTPTPTLAPTPTPTLAPTPTPTLAPTPTPTLAPVPPTFETTCEAITVSGVTDGWQFIVEPGDLLLTDGQTALAPGDYTYGLRFMGQDITSGTFTIEACATPTPQPVIVHFLKEVEGGTAQPTDFVMHLTGESSFSGVSGDTVEIPAGTYVLSEDQLPNYFSEFGGGCYQNVAPESLRVAAQVEPVADPSVTFNAGEEWTCGFRNTFVEPTTSPTDPVQSESISPSPTSTPSGSVLNETGTPQITPPPTDTVGSTGTTPGEGWRLLLLVGAGMTAAFLAVTPSKRRARR